MPHAPQCLRVTMFLLGRAWHSGTTGVTPMLMSVLHTLHSLPSLAGPEYTSLPRGISGLACPTTKPNMFWREGRQGHHGASTRPVAVHARRRDCWRRRRRTRRARSKGGGAKPRRFWICRALDALNSRAAAGQAQGVPYVRLKLRGGEGCNTVGATPTPLATGF